MAAAESSASKFLKGETAAAIQRAAGTEVVCTARDYSLSAMLGRMIAC